MIKLLIELYRKHKETTEFYSNIPYIFPNLYVEKNKKGTK